jgi:hypothetical protein
MKKYPIFLLFMLLCQIVSAQPERAVGNIAAERKIALVIGNTNYDSSVGRLKNPVTDAADMADALKRLGFTLVGGRAQLDVNKKRMLELIREFGTQIKQGGAGFFYFSGHGVQVNKRNYIIPITDLLVYEDDAESEAVEVDAIAREMEFAGNRLNILVLDACRNNNLIKRTKETGKGLAEPARQPEGTFIAFAARDGQTASDGTGRNGLFTQEFLKFLEEPNVRLDDIFTFTRNAVKKLSDSRQIPAIYYSMSGPIILKSSEIATKTGNSRLSPNAYIVDDPPKQESPNANSATEDKTNNSLDNKTNSLNAKEGSELKTFQDDRTGKWGYQDLTGATVIEPKYDWATSFSEGMAMVRLKRKRYGFINTSGAEVVPAIYHDADRFSEGLACVKLHDKHGYIDRTGKVIIPLKYTNKSMFMCGASFSEGLASVQQKGKFGYIDSTGQTVVPFTYHSASRFREGLASVSLEGKWGFIDKTGKTIIPLKYFDADDFSEGLASVKFGDYEAGKYGYIDRSGEMVIPFIYEHAGHFSLGFACVQVMLRKFAIDKKGNEITDRFGSAICSEYVFKF